MIADSEHLTVQAIVGGEVGREHDEGQFRAFPFWGRSRTLQPITGCGDTGFPPVSNTSSIKAGDLA